MKIEIRYLSKSGNTEKIAKAISTEIGAPAKTIFEPIEGETDILFIGCAVYGFGIDEEVKKFVSGLDSSVKNVAIFSTTAVVKSAYDEVRKLFESKAIKVLEKEFHCKGKFLVMHRGRPNLADLNDAKTFARGVADFINQN